MPLLLLRYWKFGALALIVLAALGWHYHAVSQARQEARAICQREKAESVAQARQQDAKTAEEAITRMAEDLRRAHQRAVAADQSREEAENEIAALEPELRRCRAPTDNDWRRLQ